MDESIAVPVGCLYIVLGILGVVLNLVTVLMIITRRVYRLSAYTLMANVALADAFVMVVAGLACGINLILCSHPNTCVTPHQGNTHSDISSAVITRIGATINARQTAHTFPINNSTFEPQLEMTTHPFVALQKSKRSMLNLIDQNNYQGIRHIRKRHRRRKKNYHILHNSPLYRYPRRVLWGPNDDYVNLSLSLAYSQRERLGQNIYVRVIYSVMAFMEISAWTAGVISYAFLGLNRCVAICFYGTKAKSLNRVSVALIASILTWIAGIAAGCVGTFPQPLVGVRLDLWTFSFLTVSGYRSATFMVISLSVHCISVLLQWICSTLVLVKIRQVKLKISKNMLNQNSANRFRKQARLTFQFFYPSLFCTISSVLYFAKPFTSQLFSDYHFIALHLVWLGNHLCNPFIYAYFNERMRVSYWEILTCAYIRVFVLRRRKQAGLRKRINVSRRSAGQQSMHRVSVRSTKSNGNFVRNSLQLQSRDFEQLCEFMMRVNPLAQSSEGWNESSSDMEELDNGISPRETRSEVIAGKSTMTHGESKRSIVGDLGRQTIEHWAAFAKKASI
ncbi:serpentine type 7TM GPCR chemoreceptor srx domain-containing protein [Ditylenchus destructor]|uniref:Serpentine type 7TM GPCR chemoreceptor srx domain-containing protein n=1 Tax=Ditylenchus destructor TaxID=166010 RepID=A0AAD4MVZ9_9BILA|nr:serpentine type 7TM GPCR chemoreceptor srx domain-containing protein [Ditylenchus destructor]